MDRWVGRWTGGQMDGVDMWGRGLVDRWVDVWMDGWTNGWIETYRWVEGWAGG